MRISDWSSDVCSSDLVDGPLTPGDVTRQVLAEGVERCIVVTDRPDLYDANSGLGEGVTVHHRDELDALQRELRDVKGFVYGWSYVWKSILGVMLFGLFIPWSMIELWNDRWKSMSFGSHRSEEHTSELQSLM